MKRFIVTALFMSLLFTLSACGSTPEVKQVNDQEAVKVLDSKKGVLFYVYDHEDYKEYEMYLRNAVDKTKETINVFVGRDSEATGKDEGSTENEFEKRIKNDSIDTNYIYIIKSGEVTDKLNVDDYYEGELSEALKDFIERNK